MIKSLNHMNYWILKSKPTILIEANETYFSKVISYNESLFARKKPIPMYKTGFRSHYESITESTNSSIAKLSPSPSSIGAELALFSADPTTNPPTPTRESFFSAPAN